MHFPANSPRYLLPDKAPRENKDIRMATEDTIRHYYTVNGKNISWYTVPVFYNVIKRVIYNEHKQTIWETKYMQHVLDCLYDAYLEISDSVPKLKKSMTW